LVVVEDGNTYDHECLYIQEEYDPRSFKQQFHSTSRSNSIAPATPRTRQSYFTSALGHMPQNQTQGPSLPPNLPSAQYHQGATRSPPPAFAPTPAPQTLSFEQFQQQQVDLQQQYQAYLQQQHQLQYPAQPQQSLQQQPMYVMAPSQPPMQMQQQHQMYPQLQYPQFYQPQYSPQGFPPQQQYMQPMPQHHHQMDQGGGGYGVQPGSDQGWS
jgi:hypothetical protein